MARTLANALREARSAAGLSAEKLAARSHCTASTVYRTEAGLTYPAIDRVAAMARGCGTDLSSLIDGVEFERFNEKAS